MGLVGENTAVPFNVTRLNHIVLTSRDLWANGLCRSITDRQTLVHSTNPTPCLPLMRFCDKEYFVLDGRS